MKTDFITGKLKLFKSEFRGTLDTFKARYNEDPQFKKQTWMVGVALLLSCLALGALPNPKQNDRTEPPLSIDAAIPEDSVLIPIKVQNEASLDGVFEESGFVDLYSAPEDDKKKSEKIISGVKMIRSPRQPDQFAVIVKSIHAPKVVRSRGGFFVALQNRNHHRVDMETKATARVVTIEKN